MRAALLLADLLPVRQLRPATPASVADPWATRCLPAPSWGCRRPAPGCSMALLTLRWARRRAPLRRTALPREGRRQPHPRLPRHHQRVRGGRLLAPQWARRFLRRPRLRRAGRPLLLVPQARQALLRTLLLRKGRSPRPLSQARQALRLRPLRLRRSRPLRLRGRVPCLPALPTAPCLGTATCSALGLRALGVRRCPRRGAPQATLRQRRARLPRPARQRQGRPCPSRGRTLLFSHPVGPRPREGLARRLQAGGPCAGVLPHRRPALAAPLLGLPRLALLRTPPLARPALSRLRAESLLGVMGEAG